MYLIPLPHKCIKCGHEFLFSTTEPHCAPVNSAGDPVCPVCWDAFLKTVGLGYCTAVFSKNGSHYDTEKAKESK